MMKKEDHSGLLFIAVKNTHDMVFADCFSVVSTLFSFLRETGGLKMLVESLLHGGFRRGDGPWCGLLGSWAHSPKGPFS